MKTLTSAIKAIFVTSLVLLFGIGVNVHAAIFEEVPFEFEDYADTALDWADSTDEGFTGSTALGFSVSIGGASYSYFDMSSNGYIELLTDAGDAPTGWDYDYISGLISVDPGATYLLAAYDDLSSLFYGYYGYKLFSDRAPRDEYQGDRVQQWRRAACGGGQALRLRTDGDGDGHHHARCGRQHLRRDRGGHRRYRRRPVGGGP